MGLPFRWLATSVLFLLLYSSSSKGQHYQALQGSNYSGALSVHNNPASIVQSPHKWDFTPVGIQGKVSTNFLYTVRKSMFAFPLYYKYHFEEGNKNRYANVNANLNMVNTRLSLGRNRAIAFGSNIRMYGNGTTSRLQFNDTIIDDLDGIITSNISHQPITAKVVGNAMWEGYFSYAQIIVEDPRFRLNAGATFKFNRGLTGGTANLEQARFTPTSSATNAAYYYSSNYDKWRQRNSMLRNIYNFTYFTQGGSSLDLGLEMLIKTQAVTTFSDEDDFYDYRWKISLSLLDIGYSKFRYGNNSHYASPNAEGVTYALLKDKFNYKVNGIRQFNDSLRTIAKLNNYPEKFNILNPTRLVLNTDYYVNRDFYINSELSLNMSSLVSQKWEHVTDISFLTITPRWENKFWGVYVPLSITDQKRFWMGGAIKAGPLVVGIHNIRYLFSNKSMQNGGGYITLLLHSSERNLPKREKWMALK